MDDLEKSLTEDQFAAVRSDAKQLRILAGAGTGKTRVLTHRIAYQSKALRIDAEHSLCLTFSKRAANELQQRLKGLGLGNHVTAGTFHAIAYAQLQARWKDLGVNTEPVLLPNREKLLFPLLPESLSAPERSFILNEINWCTAQRVSASEYVALAEKTGRRNLVQFSSVGEFYRKFVAAKKQKNYVDFDDILELAIQFLSEDTNYADARHWKFQDLFVDEFQDVNPLQFALLRSWIGNKSSLCVVGDPNQSIYSWNGADSSYLNNFADYFPGAETVHLNRNFRSTPEILSAAALLLPNKSQLTPSKQHGPLPTLRAEDNEVSEVKSIARKILSTNSGAIRWADQAVLVRTHSQIALIEEALAEKGIPFLVHTTSPLGDYEKGNDSVRVLTFHAAKGLEWKVVHISGLEEGLVPIAHAVSQEERDEERRLMYVALTRAEDELHLSWARKRRFGNRRDRNPSIFLKEISAALTASPSPARTQTKLELAKKIREFRLKRRRVAVSTYNENQDVNKLDNLKKFRTSIAKVNDVSPESIVSDAVFEKLILEMPDSIENLGLIDGLSPAIINRYGEEILKILWREF